MQTKQQHLFLLLCLLWALVLGCGIGALAAFWWAGTNGAARDTSFGWWLALIALCGATGGYGTVLTAFVLGLHRGFNLTRWLHESLFVIFFGVIAAAMAVALAYTATQCFFDIANVHWIGLCVLAGIAGIVAWPAIQAWLSTTSG